jgi:hypothetical protein
MKVKLLVVVAALLVLTSCGTVSYFESPDRLSNIEGTIYLVNGREVDGNLVVKTGNIFGSDVKVYAEGDKMPMHFSLSEIKGYRIRNDYYALKEKKGGISLGKRLSFMKRLTPENSRIHLYEGMEKAIETDKSKGYHSSVTNYKTEYYLEFPMEEGSAVCLIGSPGFVPNFDVKMSKIVSDCPSLVQKLAASEKGFFYSQVHLVKERRAEVLMNIIQEYNRCRE